MDAFLGGTNVLIFSYGVTNAGKTHTIQGGDQHASTARGSRSSV